MDTFEKSKEGKEQVRGVDGFPIYLPLLGFLILASGMSMGSVVPTVIGAVMLLGSVVGIEYLTKPKSAKIPHSSTAGSGVLHHA